MHKPKGTAGSGYWYIILIMVLLAGAAATTFVVLTTSRSIKASLVQRTESMAKLILPSLLTELKGDETDLELPAYQSLKEDFIDIRKANSDIRFIYILALRGGDSDAFFYIDSEPPESEDYSPPGQSYPEGLDDVKTTYEQKSSWVLPIERDRWGTWLSAFSPVYDDNHKVIGVLGVDVPANHFYQSVLVTAAIPLLLTFIVVMGLIFAHRRAVRQQRYLNEKAFYLSFASHEIVSPLTSVSWAMRYQSDNLAALTPKIQGTISEVLTTVNDVLSFQNLDRLGAKKLQKEPEQISALLDTLITNLSIVCDQHDVRIENHTEEADKSFQAPVDKLLFKRVLFNLIINAIKYSPKGGVIIVKLSQAPLNWTVTVHNQGETLSAEDQKRMFEGFYRTKSAEAGQKQGTGLGLMLSHDIIARHGGQLTVESAEGQGVTLKVGMPKAN